MPEPQVYGPGSLPEENVERAVNKFLSGGSVEEAIKIMTAAPSPNAKVDAFFAARGALEEFSVPTRSYVIDQRINRWEVASGSQCGIDYMKDEKLVLIEMADRDYPLWRVVKEVHRHSDIVVMVHSDWDDPTVSYIFAADHEVTDGTLSTILKEHR